MKSTSGPLGIIWAKTNPMPESVRDRPTKAHEYVFLLRPNRSYFYDAEAVREPVTGNAHPHGYGLNPKARKWPSGWSAEDGPHAGVPSGRYRPKQNASFAVSVGGLVPSRNRRTAYMGTTSWSRTRSWRPRWRRAAARPQNQDELTAVEAEVRKADEAMDRYFQAFEAGSMSEADCAPRLQALRRQLSELAERRAELMAQMDDEDDEPLPTASELIGVKEAIERALQSGTEAQRKVVMQKLVVEVQVESRSSITPLFRVPHFGQVRTLYGMAGEWLGMSTFG